MLLSNYTFSVDLSLSMLFERVITTEVETLFQNHPVLADFKFFKLLTDDGNQGLTISMQLFFNDTEQFMEFELNYQEALFTLLDKHFPNKYVYFKSLLEEYR